MLCHLCLRETAQATYKGSSYCVKCLWGEFPKLKEIQNSIVKGTYNGKEKK